MGMPFFRRYHLHNSYQALPNSADESPDLHRPILQQFNLSPSFVWRPAQTGVLVTGCKTPRPPQMRQTWNFSRCPWVDHTPFRNFSLHSLDAFNQTNAFMEHLTVLVTLPTFKALRRRSSTGSIFNSCASISMMLSTAKADWVTQTRGKLLTAVIGCTLHSSPP